MDSNAVDTYDSGDEWDIGVGNLIIDLDADLEKDKLEMSSSKEGGAAAMAAPPSAVAALPDNIKFVSPVAAAQGKESKSKSKRSKNSKESVKAPAPDGAKKEVQGRGPAEPPPPLNPSSSPASKGGDKCSKPSRTLPPSSSSSSSAAAVKKEKEGPATKAKKDKAEGASPGGLGADKEAVVPVGAPRSCGAGGGGGPPFEGQQQQNADLAAAEHLGNVALEPVGPGQPVAMTTELEEVDGGDGRGLKKVVSVKVSGCVCVIKRGLVDYVT